MDWIGRRVEVRETRDKIEIQLDARRLVTHRRIAEAEHQRVMLAEHRPPRGRRDTRPDPHPEEKAIVAAAPELADYVVGLKQRSRKVVTLALRQLLRLVREYPREPLLGAVHEAGRSAELVKEALGAVDERAWTAFSRKVRREMRGPDRGRELNVLAALSHHTNLSAGCYCQDESRCHRSLLRKLLAERDADVI